MKTRAEIASQIKQLSFELAQELDEIPGQEEYGSPFAALEAYAAEIGDMLTRGVALERARMESEARLGDPRCKSCPQCSSPGDLKGHRKRELQTVRGTTELTEPEYYCKKCRRSFFPSDSVDRS